MGSNKRGTWSSAAKGILNEIGNSDNFIDASCCNIDYALSIISLHDDVDWEDKRFSSEKLRYYNLYKSEKNVEDYLLLDLTKFQRSILAQYRCGILPLQIEVGRYRNIELSQRICPMCNLEVEDEIHFLLTCNSYAEIRSKLFKDASSFDCLFSNFNVFEKFTFLM